MKKDNCPVIRPATAQDIESFYGRTLPYTVRAWAVDYKDETVCLAGVCHIPGLGSLAFSELREHEASPIVVYRTAARLFEKIKSLNVAVVADPRQNIPEIAIGAARFLKRLGFKEVEGGLYKWDN